MSGRAPLILLVDDDADFVAMNRHVLEAAGYRVAACHDAEAAIEAMKAETPDLVVSDLMMSSLDSGFSLARQVKKDPLLRRVPVIIVTSVARQTGMDLRPQSPEDLAAMHADAYFDKPVPPAVLLEKVAELVARASKG